MARLTLGFMLMKYLTIMMFLFVGCINLTLRNAGTGMLHYLGPSLRCRLEHILNDHFSIETHGFWLPVFHETSK